MYFLSFVNSFVRNKFYLQNFVFCCFLLSMHPLSNFSAHVLSVIMFVGASLFLHNRFFSFF